jgi:hypothetical protein
VDDVLDDIETWFERRGVPQFIARRKAASEVFTRSLPLLVLFYLLGGMLALDSENWSWGRNVLVAIGVVAVLVATWCVANRLRGRTTFSIPERVGPVELALFVVGPTIPTLVFDPHLRSFLTALAFGLLSLVVVYLFSTFGVGSIARWGLSQARALAPTFVTLVARALPLLLISVVVLFLTGEVWQFSADLTGLPYAITLFGIFGLGAAFLIARLPGDVHNIAAFSDWSEVRSVIDGTPAAQLVLPDDGDPDESPLTKRQWFNVSLVTLFTQAMQITFVALAMFVVLLAFGFVAIHLSTQTSFVGAAEKIDVLATLNLGGEELVITSVVLRVCGFLATFAGFYFTVYLATDATYRDEFRTDIVPEVRQAFAVRTAYRSCLGEKSAGRASVRKSATTA